MRSGSDAIGDPDLAELTNEEIIDALDILEKIKNNQHHTKQLSDREVTCFVIVCVRQSKINYIF